MKPPATTFVGPLGSTVHVVRADAGTIAELAAVDWSRHFRRVCLDPVRGLITLTSPSNLHEDLTRAFDDIVETAADGLARISKKLGSVRLRGSGEPPGTGMEADCTFYVGERAERYQAASREGEAAAEAFLVDTAPDLVVETEITSADEGKAERYARSACGNCGGCMAAGVRASFGPISSPCDRTHRRGGSPSRRCWRA